MKPRSCSAALVLLFLYSCTLTDSKLIAIKNTNFNEQIQSTQNLEFVFNRNLFADSMTNRWVQEELLVFDPPMDGMCRITGVDRIVFSPSRPFRESEQYIIRLGKGIYKHTNVRLALSEKDWRVHTPLLTDAISNLFWTKDDANGQVILNAELTFSATVHADSIAKKLAVQFRNQPVPTVVTTAGITSKVNILMRNISPQKTDDKLQISIAEGISSPGSIYKTDKKIVLEETLPFIEYVEIRSMEPEHNGFRGVINVVTNQQIANTNIQDAISIKPEIVFHADKLANGFSISSAEFDPLEKYTITIKETLLGIAGGKMPDAYSETIAFAELEPMLRFANSNGKYLNSRGNRNLAIDIVNVSEIKVTVAKIYENNILSFLRRENEDSWGGNEYYDDDEYYYSRYRGFSKAGNYGTDIFEKVYQTKDFEGSGFASVLHLDNLHPFEKFSGFYVITVRSTNDQWLGESKIVSVSDIGLIAKTGNDEITVFANSIQTATPASGVQIHFISRNNQTLKSITTNADGVATFTGVQKNFGDFEVAMITAVTGNDFNFLPFDNTAIETSRFDVGGKRMNASNYDAFLYPERDLYRPGETVHFTGIVRDYNWRTISSLPVKIKILTPGGKEFKSIKKNLNANGAFEAAAEMPQSCVTGLYSIQLYTVNDILLATQNISVEEFMPDRMKVTTSLNKKEFLPGDEVATTIQADNLFGTPAAGRSWSCDMHLRRSWFSSKKYPNYSFSMENNTSLQSNYTSGITSENGTAKASFTLSNGLVDMGIVEGTVLATAFDESARPVYSAQDFKIYTQDVFYGIGNFDSYVGTKQVITIPIIALDKNETLVQKTKVKVDIIRDEYLTVTERHNGYYRYRSNKSSVNVLSEIIEINGQYNLKFIPEFSGDYVIRLRRPDGIAYIEQHFHAYGWSDTRSTSFEVNTEGNIDIIPDKENYKTGQTAKLLFTTPFNGKMLVTVETNKVAQYFYINTSKKTATLELPVTDKLLPNVFVTATLFKPHDDTPMPLTVAHGIVSLKVDNVSKTIPVKITAEKKSRSNKKQTVSIQTAPNAELTVAVVDEGILQVKNFKTPDPYSFFYGTRALQVNSYDMYAYLYPEVIGKKLLTGGDEGGGRINPMLAKRVKLVSYWSGIIKADGNGKAKFSFDIPQFSGDLRVMAVSYKSDQFGSAVEHIKVADPIVVTTSLPRFLSPGDTISIAVTLANTTEKEASGNVSLLLTGPVKMLSRTSTTFTVNANKEARVEFKICATNMIGNAEVHTKVEALNEIFKENIEISVRPAASLQKQSGYGEVLAGKSSTVSFANNFLPEGSNAKLIISRSPVIQFSKNLDYLIEYPHGCVEQITSGAFPQIYFSDLVKDLYGKENKNLDPAHNVQQGINILQSMQLYNGALSYWPGGGSESWWGSVYACNFLVEAKKAGYDVDERVIDHICAYMKEMLKQKRNFQYFYNDSKVKEIAPKEAFYSLYVLALAGKAEISTMNYYKANPSYIPLDGKYLLAASYGLAGDMKTMQKILPTEFTGEESVQQFGGSFHSPIRDLAISLNCLLEADPEHVQIPMLAKQLSQKMQAAKYLNTQENAFGFVALGKVSRRSKDSNVTATIRSDGKSIAEFSGKNLVISDKNLLNSKIEIEAKGTGQLYYFWMISGITRDGSFKQEDSFMTVRKKFFDRWGHEITNLRSIKQNDLVVVKISAKANTTVENVVITDMLPAGFEIENDRLRQVSLLNWVKDGGKCAYEDIRDDRINLYCDLSSITSHYYYIVRAVSPGVYRMGPVMADAMYNEEYHSYNGAGWVQINR
ncbi:MAG: alpha-2-macroglobulin family protein [Chitinophagales bacterium]